MHSAGVSKGVQLRTRPVKGLWPGSGPAKPFFACVRGVQAPPSLLLPPSPTSSSVCPPQHTDAHAHTQIRTHTNTHTHTHQSLTSDFSRLAMAFVNSIRNYSEKKLIGYSREQLFDVVAAVENYHLFVPACRKSDVLQRSNNHLKAKLEIGIPPLLESYTSNVKLIRPKLVTASCVEGVLFKHLETRWRFSQPPKPYLPDQVCLLDFYVSFEFKTLLYAKLATPIFDEMVRLNVSAFLKRAHHLYGPQNKVNQLVTQQY